MTSGPVVRPGDLPPFVHTLSSLTAATDETEPELDAETVALLDEMRHCRAQAEVSSRDYLIWR